MYKRLVKSGCDSQDDSNTKAQFFRAWHKHCWTIPLSFNFGQISVCESVLSNLVPLRLGSSHVENMLGPLPKPGLFAKLSKNGCSIEKPIFIQQHFWCNVSHRWSHKMRMLNDELFWKLLSSYEKWASGQKNETSVTQRVNGEVPDLPIGFR